MTKNAVTYIYRRYVAKSVKKGEESITVYVYSPVDIVSGFELDEFGKKKFFSDKDTQFSYIEDDIDIDEEFVYAFPLYVPDKRPSTLEKAQEILYDKVDELNEHILYQKHSPGFKLVTFASNDDCKTSAKISPDNFDEFEAMLKALYKPTDSESNIDDYKNLEGEEEVVETSDFKTPTGITIIVPKTETFKTDDLFEHVTRTIICQDEHVRKIVTAFAKNQSIASLYEANKEKGLDVSRLIKLKQNLFVCGPTGVGKTAILKKVAEASNVPIIVEDAARYTMAGYKGEDPENILKNLIRKTNGDLEAARKGIIVIDEMDKKAERGDISSATTTEVQSAFLTMMQGNTYNLEFPLKTGGTGLITFDTSAVTFIFLGACSGIEQYSERNKKHLGFASEKVETVEEKLNNSDIYTPENMIKYGMKSEFMGRLMLVALDSLDDEDVMSKLVVESDESPLVLNQELYRLAGINLNCPEESIKALARKAIEYKAGARGIEKVFNNILSNCEYDIFSSNAPKEVIITPEAVEDPTQLILKY